MTFSNYVKNSVTNLFKFTFAVEITGSEFQEKEIKWYEMWMAYIKSALPRVGLDGQSVSDFLEFLGRFSMARIMQFGIVKKNPSFADRFMKAAQAMGNVSLGYRLSGSYYDVVRKGYIEAPLVNKKGSDMAEKSAALYELVAAEARAAGVPVLEKMPTSAKKTPTLLNYAQVEDDRVAIQ